MITVSRNSNFWRCWRAEFLHARIMPCFRASVRALLSVMFVKKWNYRVACANGQFRCGSSYTFSSFHYWMVAAAAQVHPQRDAASQTFLLFYNSVKKHVEVQREWFISCLNRSPTFLIIQPFYIVTSFPPFSCILFRFFYFCLFLPFIYQFFISFPPKHNVTAEPRWK